MPDTEIIAECLSGSYDRYRELVERHTADVRAFVRAEVAAAGRGQVEDVDEVAVESFTRAWLSLGSLRDPEAFAPWVKGIAVNVMKERARRRLNEPVWGPQPAEEVSSDPALSEAIEGLPAELRGVIELRFFGGLSCERIAAREGVAIGTVTKRLSRAYAALRERLGSSRPARGRSSQEVEP